VALSLKLDEVPRPKVPKNTGVLWGFYATCVGVYCYTLKIELVRPNLT